jgi:hypothetical protein
MVGYGTLDAANLQDVGGLYHTIIEEDAHGSLIFIGVLRIYNMLYFLLLEDLSIFLIVFSGLLSAKWAVVHNTIEPALEVLCSSKLNFQFLEVNFKNERTVRRCLYPASVNASNFRHLWPSWPCPYRLL